MQIFADIEVPSLFLQAFRHRDSHIPIMELMCCVLQTLQKSFHVSLLPTGPSAQFLIDIPQECCNSLCHDAPVSWVGMGMWPPAKSPAKCMLALPSQHRNAQYHAKCKDATERVHLTISMPALTPPLEAEAGTGFQVESSVALGG